MTAEILVDEGEDVDIYLRFNRRVPGSTATTPYVLTGVSAISVIVKATLAEPDSPGKFTYTLGAAQIAVIADGSGVGATYSEIQVKCQGSDQTPPGNYYFKVKVTKATRTETIQTGIWRIRNT